MTSDAGRCSPYSPIIWMWSCRPEACREIEAHIAGCSPCIESADSLRKTVFLCRRYEPSEPPAPLKEEARTQLLMPTKKCSRPGEPARDNKWR